MNAFILLTAFIYISYAQSLTYWNLHCRLRWEVFNMKPKWQKTSHAVCSELRRLGSSIDYTVCHHLQSQHAFPCGWGCFCLGIWWAAVFNNRKLEHILSFRQNLSVNIHIVVLFSKVSHLLGGTMILLMLFIEIGFLFLFGIMKIQHWKTECINNTG